MALNGRVKRLTMSTPSHETARRVLDAVDQSGAHYGSGFPMIASENVISPMVRRACDSDLHGRYAEGLPGKRYYQGCDDFDTIDTIGFVLAKKVFNANFANIQPISGTVANIAALKAMVKPGDASQPSRPRTADTFPTPRWAQWVCVASTFTPTRGTKTAWNRTSTPRRP